MKYLIFCCFCLLALLFSCAPELEEPAEVLRAYQASYDKNDFEAAAAYCTPTMQQQLQVLEEMLAMDLDSTILETEFLQLDCRVSNDSAFCDAILKDQYETYPAAFLLLRSSKGWLVDLPFEEAIDYNKEVIDARDSLLNQ